MRRHDSYSFLFFYPSIHIDNVKNMTRLLHWNFWKMLKGLDTLQSSIPTLCGIPIYTIIYIQEEKLMKI